MVFDRAKAVCFTGHRAFYDKKEEIESKLEDAVRQCIEDGYEVFIAGGAVGVDTLAAETVINLRKEYPNIRLVLALPCPPEQQSMKWSENQKKQYHNTIDQADEVRILSDKYTSTCMLDRNRYMVDNSCKVICYLQSARGGTKFTVEYAKKQGIEIVYV